jgi:1-deoxy-D-xylulose-5-phosphate reductoisomerase
MESISILGSTGSIGRSTLEVVDNLKQRFQVTGMAAGRNFELFCQQVKKYYPQIVSLEREEDAERFKQACGEGDISVVFGPEGAEEVARYSESTIVVSSITGIDGLKPTLAAVKSGKKVALANKESMVVAGPLIQAEVEKSGAEIIPVDSEHSGVFQCLAKEKTTEVKTVILTASGGPFFNTSAEEMRNKTVREALNHPRWKMGEKVTIDSATLMNKGLELIEARWLFGLEPDQLAVLIHPQSIVHSLVEMKDGAVLAQLSQTDMKIPIQYALTYPEREESSLPALDLAQIQSLDFYEVDSMKFPLIALAGDALKKDASYSVALNAANEVAVEAFLKEAIPFHAISEIVTEAVENHQAAAIGTVDHIFQIDRVTREFTRNLLEQR